MGWSRIRHTVQTSALLLLTSVLAISGAGAPAAAADEAAWMYDPNAVVEVDLGLSQEEIDALEAEPDEYQPGTFELKVKGVLKGPDLGDVGIRLKGGLGSFRPLSEKAAFKIKFNEYTKQTFFGLKKLTLNNMVQDPSMLHETLTYELFRALDLPASRTGYAFVRLSGVEYGLYLNIETLDSISLPRWFESTQHLYEADAPGLDVAPENADKFEVDEGDDEELADLEALIAAADDDEGDWSDGMAAAADLEEMTRMWAVERYVGHWDGYAGVAAPFRPNNYYLHSDDAGLFTMLPWGTDQTWDTRVEFDEEAGGLLFNRCLADASCNALYVDALEEVQSAVGPLALDSHAAARSELLRACQALETEPRREYSAVEIEEGVEDAREFIAERPEELADWLESPAAGPPAEGQPIPPGNDPCSPPEPPQPGPETGSTSNANLNSPQPGRRLWIGPSRAAGAVVSTHFNVPEAGRATQRVTTRIDGRRSTVCAANEKRRRAGLLIVRCRISDRAISLLESRPLRLKVRAGFIADDGGSTFDTRRLTLPRRP